MTAGGRPPGFRQAFGADGEAAVADWYLARGFAVVERNWRTREGEIDLVVGRAGLLVFCEVKTRAGLGFGAPVEAVTPAKQRRIRALAARWLATHDTRASGIRFDVASVLHKPGTDAVIEVVESAF